MDPFCGRGTTNMAARLLGLPSLGIDSHPLAVATTRAKLVSTHPGAISEVLEEILDGPDATGNIPTGEFWESAYEESTAHRNLQNSQRPPGGLLLIGQNRSPCCHAWGFARPISQTEPLLLVQSEPAYIRAEAEVCGLILAKARPSPEESRCKRSRHPQGSQVLFRRLSPKFLPRCCLVTAGMKGYSGQKYLNATSTGWLPPLRTTV